ncbi:nucleotidyl transferase AbiEii/AbiGii toxin family protein [Candidatus Bathyarchaeota archaeon]|nr:nucleotidyl transferase AbiEii/AbiGii toxin family protein [Candidatus Bathyarchaeota archaeon]MBS7613183.1 nucleotidyl transferase AbiEii/AbiGii toxin family protein [Candidatus Bathyarchaeota archaeon]MBS7618531.1 nucleotidyl transferase AbiEii/AbiGii toxin family protein [Candidatus Bathyarchaeota archaeon]
MPRVIEMMKKREEELLKAILHLSEKSCGFTNPRLLLTGGYALRAFIPFSRFTRDCDFIVRKKDGWNLDDLKAILPEGYSVEKEEKHKDYGFMRWTKFIQYNKVKVRVSLDFMEGEIRGRKAEEIILIDEAMVKNSNFVPISIADESISIAVPSYLDYFIMKVVSSRASDIRDIASLIHENGIPQGLKDRLKEILPHPRVFELKIEQRIIPELRKATFLDSWKGIFATTQYTEKDKEKVIEQLEKYCRVKNFI